MPSSYFSDAANILMNGMGSNLFAKAGNLISGIAPVFQIGFGIYMLLVVLDYHNRGLDEKAVDLGKRVIGWLIIIACAFNASQYAKIANIAWTLPDNLSGLFGTAEYTASALDSNINNIVETWAKSKPMLLNWIGIKFPTNCCFIWSVSPFLVWAACFSP